MRLVKAVIAMVAGTGLFVFSCVILILPFAEPPRDPNRFLYILGTRRVEAFAKAVERFREDCGQYPSARDGLCSLVINPGVQGWHGPYVSEVPLDPWHMPYVYLHLAGSKPEILSYGADRKPGGRLFDTDISSRNLWQAIAESPLEIRARRILIGVWTGAWIGLIGSALVLRRTSR